MTDEKEKQPLTFRIAGWYGFIFSAVFLLYGGVSIILGILDRNYDDLTGPILFAILGLILISLAFAYWESKSWGWYGLIAVNALVIISAAFNPTDYKNIVLIVFSAVALYALLSETTRQYLARHG